MNKPKVNDSCYCGSDKKYKKCCLKKDVDLKYNENLKYTEGQTEHSDKITFCINFYSKLFENHKIINITNHVNKDNYKTYLMKNLNMKTIMLIEKTESNEELFMEKSDSNGVHRNDIIIMYKGGYKIFPCIDILKYEDDIKKFIDYR